MLRRATQDGQVIVKSSDKTWLTGGRNDRPLTVWITTNCGKLLKDMGIPDHFTCVLRNLYAGQEATFRTRHGTTDRLKTGKGV